MGGYLLGSGLLSISLVLQLIIPTLLEDFADGIQHLSIRVSDLWNLAAAMILLGVGIFIFRSSGRIYIIRLSRILEQKGITYEETASLQKKYTFESMIPFLRMNYIELIKLRLFLLRTNIIILSYIGTLVKIEHYIVFWGTNYVEERIYFE